MSRAAKATLIGSIIFTGFTVWGVHFMQEWERDRMYQGVIRDDERRREKLRKAAEPPSLDSNVLKDLNDPAGNTGFFSTPSPS